MTRLLPKVSAMLIVAAVSVLAIASRDESVKARAIDGQSRLTSINRLTPDAARCEAPASYQTAMIDAAPAEAIPVNPVTVALAMQQGTTTAPGRGAAADPLAAKKAAVAARKPVRKIFDR